MKRLHERGAYDAEAGIGLLNGCGVGSSLTRAAGATAGAVAFAVAACFTVALLEYALDARSCTVGDSAHERFAVQRAYLRTHAAKRPDSSPCRRRARQRARKP